jgi:hypothetical protein
VGNLVNSIKDIGSSGKKSVLARVLCGAPKSNQYYSNQQRTTVELKDCSAFGRRSISFFCKSQEALTASK